MGNLIQERKQQKTPYDYYGTGFKIKIMNPKYVKIFDEWTLDIDYQKLDNHVYKALALKEGLLTGSEIHFIRLHSGLTMAQFGERLSVSHAAVSNWEKTKDEITKMDWNTEREIRMFILGELKTKTTKFFDIWSSLKTQPKKTTTPPIKVESTELVAS